jgi:hypothetical protein
LLQLRYFLQNIRYALVVALLDSVSEGDAARAAKYQLLLPGPQPLLQLSSLRLSLFDISTASRNLCLVILLQADETASHRLSLVSEQLRELCHEGVAEGTREEAGIIRQQGLGRSCNDRVSVLAQASQMLRLGQHQEKPS